MTPDSELLARFARTNAEDAFAELVKRHVNLVYSAALRQVNGDAHLAQDVAQAVFTDLARKAGSLARGRDTSSSLTGWLYTAAHHAAAKMVRGENRRRDREEIFMRESTSETAPETDWEKLRPTLDDAMHELKEADREAILLRYFESRQFAEVGVKVGLNENAARMRVERALEKLRDILARRGIAATAALASVISANAVQLAPAGLAAALTTASIISAGTGTFTLMKIITATKLKFAASALVVAGATTALVVQHQAQVNLRSDNAALAQQLGQLRSDNENLSNRLATAGDAQALSDKERTELLKLRGEVGVLQRQINESKNLQKTNSQPHSEFTQEQQKQREQIQQLNQKINHGRIWTAAIQQFTLEHQGQGLALTNFDQLKSFVHQYDELAVSNEFEIVNEGAVTNLDYPEIIIVLREKEATQIANGKLWQRWYGFADGNIKPITSTNGNFDDFESKHMVSSQSQSQ